MASDPSATFDAAFGAIIGRRAEQQDDCRLALVALGKRRNGQLLLVADGMGGHAGGRVASATAVEAFLEGFGAEPGAALARRLAHGLTAANEALAEKVAATPQLQGMGCTLVAAVLEGRKVTWISVGDTLLVASQGGRLKRLNADHSMGGVLDARAAAGEISEEEARTSPQRHMLRAAVTGDRIALIDEGEATLAPGALLFAATDGVLTLASAELAGLAAEAASPAGFIQAALDAIGADMPDDQDNTTVAAVTVPGAPLRGAGGGGTRPVDARPAPVRATTRSGSWRSLLAILLLLLAVAAVALVGMVLWQGRASAPAPATDAAPASQTPAPSVPGAPKAASRRDAREGVDTFPVGPLGRPRPLPPKPKAARPPARPPAPKARPAATPATRTPPPPTASAPSTISPAARDALDVTVEQARQQPPRPKQGPRPD